MKTRVSILICLLFCFISSAFAQGISDAGVLFLMIQPSLRANGMGGVSIAAVGDDALAVAFNPAHAGRLANDTNFMLEFYPVKTDWLPAFSGPTYDSKAVFGGYNLRRLNKRIPLSIGVAYSRVFLDLGEQTLTDETGNEIGSFHSTESVNVWSIGIGIDYLLKAGIGFNFKNIESNLGFVGAGFEEGAGGATATARDFGIIAYLPLDEVLLKPISKTLNSSSGPRLSFGPSFGYSRSNVGDEISYIDAAQASPLPRVARIGIGLRAGLSYETDELSWQFLSFELLNEAEQLLVRTRNDGSVSYADGTGDIDFWDNVVLGKSNPMIVSKRGGELSIFEIISIRRGRYKDPLGHVNYKTEGIGLSLRGVFKTISMLNPDLKRNPTIGFLIKHTDVQFSTSDWEINPEHPLAGTSFSGIRISIF